MERIKTLLKTLWVLSGRLPYLRLGLLLAVIITVIYMTQCGSSKTDQEVQRQTAEVVVKTVEEKHSEAKAEEVIERVKTADKKVASAQSEVRKVRGSKRKDVSVEDATKDVAEALPGTKDEPVSGKTVTVPQEFVDNAAQLARENVVLKQANDTLVEANKIKDEALAAKDEVIKAKDEKISVLTDQVETLKKTKCSKTVFLFGLIKNTKCK